MRLGELDGENWGKKRIEKLLNANIPSFIGLEKSVNGIKTSITRSLGEFDNFAVSYNKESSVLKDSLEQVIRVTIYVIATFYIDQIANFQTRQRSQV